MQNNDYWLISYSSGVLTVVKLTVHFQVGETPLQEGEIEVNILELILIIISG